MFEFNAKFTEAEKIILTTAILQREAMGVLSAPQTQEEFDKWCEDQIAKVYEARLQEEAKRERKAATEAKKAAEMGKTVEEYRDYKRCEANAKKHRYEIHKAEREIERLMKEIEYHKAKAAYWEKEKGE